MKPDQFQHQHQTQQEQQQLVDSSPSSSPVSGDKNVMPSVILRQQRIQMGMSANQRGEQTSQQQPNPTSSSILTANEQQQQQLFDQDGLVLPKRVVHHPISLAQPIIRDLNRELKFNQIRGKNVLDQKSELKKALEKLEENKRKKEAEQERLNRRTSLELRLEERAERIAKNSMESSKQIPGQQKQPTASVEGAGTASNCNHLSNFSIKSVTR